MSSSEYRDELSRAMEMIAAQPGAVFLGQGVAAPGTFMSTTLTGVPDDQKIELPVAEEMQLGMSIGLALDGYLPVSVYPRLNFLFLAVNQLVNHLDVMKAKVIVRVGIGSTKPLDPGPQHKGDFTAAFRMMLDMPVHRLDRVEDIMPGYERALREPGPVVMVEWADKYHG